MTNTIYYIFIKKKQLAASAEVLKVIAVIKNMFIKIPYRENSVQQYRPQTS